MQQGAPKMEYRKLGKTGLKVSTISYGNWLNANDPATIQRNKEIIKHAWDLGINFFDTAEVYGFGQAEIQFAEALHELMKEKNVKREDLVISTKLFMGSNEPSQRFPNSQFLSRKRILEGIKGSLKRLQLDYVDILFAHRFDNITPLEEQCKAFDWVVRKGFAHYWGTSEWNPQQIFEAVGICERLGLVKPVVEQPQYNMMVRDRFEWEYLQVFEGLNYGSTVWSPLAGGVLSGKYNDSLDVEGRLSNMSDSPIIQKQVNTVFADREKTQNKLKKLGEIAQRLGCSQATFAMAWVIKNRDVSSAITSASRPEQLDDTVRAVEIYKLITPEIEKEIDEVLGNKPVTPFGFPSMAPQLTRREKQV